MPNKVGPDATRNHLLASLRATYRQAQLPSLNRYAASASTLLVGTLCQLVTFVLLARALGIEQFGTLIVISAITSLAIAFCGVGAGDTMVRGLVRGPEAYPALLGHGILLIASTGVALTVLASWLLELVLSATSSMAVHPTTIALFAVSNIPLSASVWFVERIFIGRHEFGRANAVNVGFSLIRLLAAMVACLAAGMDSLDQWALWAFAANGLALAVAVAMLWPVPKPVWRVDCRELRLGFHYSTPFVVDALRQNLDRIILGVVVPVAVLGGYGTAFRIVQTAQMIISALNRVAYPAFVRQSRWGSGRVLHMAILYSVMVCTVAAAASIGLFAAAPFLPPVLGSEYEPVIRDLSVLCWLLIPLTAQTVPYDVLGALDRHHVRARMYNGASLAVAAGSVPTIYFFGLLGAFVSAYVTHSLLAAALWVSITREAARETGGPSSSRKA